MTLFSYRYFQALLCCYWNFIWNCTLSDPCLVGQSTQHNLCLPANCSSPHVVARGAIPALVGIPGSFFLAHQHTWICHCQGSCALHLACDHCTRLQMVTRGSLSSTLLLSIHDTVKDTTYKSYLSKWAEYNLKFYNLDHFYFFVASCFSIILKYDSFLSIRCRRGQYIE